MNRIIKDRQIVTDDCQHLADDASLPISGRFSVSLVRWRKDKADLQTLGDRVGIRLPNDIDVDELWPEIKGISQVVLDFPKFGDGRAMSQARVLRLHHSFCGEIRAIGDVLRDQMFYMHRCGINAFEPRPDRSLEDALKAFSEISFTYQSAADTNSNVFRQRSV